jgi:hypothetical protein
VPKIQIVAFQRIEKIAFSRSVKKLDSSVKKLDSRHRKKPGCGASKEAHISRNFKICADHYGKNPRHLLRAGNDDMRAAILLGIHRMA